MTSSFQHINYLCYPISIKLTTEQLLKRIGQNIKRIRLGKGILQQDLAAICNFETSVMSRIEAGGSNFTIGILKQDRKWLADTHCRIVRLNDDV